MTGALVTVIDDDESVRESLPDLLRSFGFAAQSFASGEDFLASNALSATKCLVLDVAMPGMSGPDLKRELDRRKQAIPIIFITAHQDDMTCERLMQQGAVDCLYKPFDPSALIRALKSALTKGSLS
jgi:FixJ family two-component response regulator